MKDIRFQTKDVRDAVGLVASRGRALSDGVDKVNTSHPLIVGELDLAGKVVEMAEEAAEDEAVAGGDVRAHGLNHMAGEVGVEAARGLGRALGLSLLGSGAHCDGCLCGREG